MTRNASEHDAARFGYALGKADGARLERGVIAGAVAIVMLEQGYPFDVVARVVRTISEGVSR